MSSESLFPIRARNPCVFRWDFCAINPGEFLFPPVKCSMHIPCATGKAKHPQTKSIDLHWVGYGLVKEGPVAANPNPALVSPVKPAPRLPRETASTGLISSCPKETSCVSRQPAMGPCVPASQRGGQIEMDEINMNTSKAEEKSPLTHVN